MIRIFGPSSGGASSIYQNPVDATWKHFHHDFLNDSANIIQTDGGSMGIDILIGVTGSTHRHLNVAVPSNRYGIHEMIVGTGAGSFSAGSTDVFSMSSGGGEIRTGAAVRIPTLPTDEENFTMAFGINDKSTNLGTNYAVLAVDRAVSTTHWVTKTKDGTTENTTVTSVALSADDYFNLEVILNAAGTSVDMYIDGVNVLTSGINLPSGPININFHLFRTNNTVVRSLYIDWINLLVKPTTARGAIATWVS